MTTNFLKPDFGTVIKLAVINTADGCILEVYSQISITKKENISDLVLARTLLLHWLYYIFIICPLQNPSIFTRKKNIHLHIFLNLFATLTFSKIKYRQEKS